jgi:hypothetical protein
MLSYERIDDLMILLTVSFEHIYVLWLHPGGHIDCKKPTIKVLSLRILIQIASN